MFHPDLTRQLAAEHQRSMREQASRWRTARAARAGEREAHSGGRHGRQRRGSPAAYTVVPGRAAGTLAVCGSAGTERALS
jgi:hypothetical protein